MRSRMSGGKSGEEGSGSFCRPVKGGSGDSRPSSAPSRRRVVWLTIPAGMLSTLATARRTTRHRNLAWSGASSPVFDAVMVGGEAVPNPPQHCLGAASDIDLAVDGSDVGLHRVRADAGQRCQLGVCVALVDQGYTLLYQDV